MTDKIKLIEPIFFFFNGNYYSFNTILIASDEGDFLRLNASAGKVKPYNAVAAPMRNDNERP